MQRLSPIECKIREGCKNLISVITSLSLMNTSMLPLTIFGAINFIGLPFVGFLLSLRTSTQSLRGSSGFRFRVSLGSTSSFSNSSSTSITGGLLEITSVNSCEAEERLKLVVEALIFLAAPVSLFPSLDSP
ncbi:unnamed protein product [Vicia faba]|uniref:Uncharacterized protein n=1 Tax=Vicia faba TaxID=3906 RepID=A0AAV0YE61_VICFA|nr:unnamed protein product [Vicia faba]